MSSAARKTQAREFVRPLRLGLSVGHATGTCGTLGAFVREPGGRIGFLSTATVLAPLRAQAGDFIHQPSALDADLTGSTRAGELSRHVTTRSSVQSTNYDAAVAWLHEPQNGPFNIVPPDVPDAGRAISLEGPPPIVGDLVAMVGRSSGHSHGTIEVLERFVQIRDRRDTFEFDGCISVRGALRPFSLPGDAGALVWRVRDGRAVGMVFASGPGQDGSPTVTYLLPLGPILDLFGLSFA